MPDNHCTTFTRSLRRAGQTLPTPLLWTESRWSQDVRMQLDNILPVDCHADDPAVLIGLAVSFMRQGHRPDDQLLRPLLVRLHALASDGDAACRMVLDWIWNRGGPRQPDELSSLLATQDVAANGTQRLTRLQHMEGLSNSRTQQDCGEERPGHEEEGGVQETAGGIDAVKALLLEGGRGEHLHG
jgi:hypothetical protein